ncbi:MAG: c-type cytochrome [Dehalococcoidia bacterium]|nr:c-type cytochrome [Dehalococcoidia bacterium]
MNTTKQIQVMTALIVLLVVGLLAYTVWEPTRQQDAEARQLETSVEYGAELFANNCAVCHGLRGEGFVGPMLDKPANRPTNPAELTKLQDRLSNTIVCGRVGTFMPAWAQAQGGSLNDEMVRQLVLLITTNAGDGWEQVAEQTKTLGIKPTQPTADQINQGACGQVYKPAPTPTGPPPPPKSAWGIAMKDNSFDPALITVTAGQAATISLRNEGSAIHNMRIAGTDAQYDTSDDTVSSPDTVRPNGTASLSFTAAAAGTLKFRCDFHPVDMVGTITVQ